MAVFISYRREDSEGDARALYNRLADETDPKNLFLDFEAIGAGEDWRLRINEHLSKVKAVLVLIGPRWLDVIRHREAARVPDEVRNEIAAALKKPDLKVLPILVQGAKMPAPVDLPEDVRGLASRNALEVRGTAWADDTARVVKALRKAGALPISSKKWLWRGAAAAGLVAAATLSVDAMRVTVPVVPKNMSHKYAKELIEKHGLVFKARVLPYVGDNRGIHAVVDQRPAAGSKLFRGQTVEVEVISKQPYYLVCRGGGNFAKVTLGDTVAFERHKGAATPDMKPGSCSWAGAEIHWNQDEVLKPLGFKDKLPALFEAAPGNMLALCVFSEYDLGEKAVKSERYAALDHTHFMIRDDNGKLVPRLGGHICVDHVVQ